MRSGTGRQGARHRALSEAKPSIPGGVPSASERGPRVLPRPTRTNGYGTEGWATATMEALAGRPPSAQTAAKLIPPGAVGGPVPAPRSARPVPSRLPGPPLGAPHARIHIAPVGFEVERVTAPLETDRADRVYLLTRAEHDAAAPFVEEVVRRLRRAPWPMDVRVVRTDLWDVFHALSSLREVFEEERRLDRSAREVLPLRVNVSTGTKITAIAGTLACMLWNGAPYYAQVSKAWYSGRTPRVGAVTDVVERVEPVGVYELRSPSAELVEVLDALGRRGGALRKRDLIRELHLDRPGPDGGKAVSPQAQHGRLRRRLEPLERRWGFVRTESPGPRSRVLLTEQGRLALALFGEHRGAPS